MGSPWRLEGEWARKKREAYTPWLIIDARILALNRSRKAASVFYESIDQNVSFSYEQN